MVDLRELFNKCVADVPGNDETKKIRGAKRFLISAKKENPKVTMGECMEICGFSDADPKKAANLAQTFRTKVLNPLRDHLALVRFQIKDTNPIFGRTGVKRTDEQSKARKEILSYLPALTRNRVAVAAGADDDMSYLDDLIADDIDDNDENDEIDGNIAE